MTGEKGRMECVNGQNIDVIKCDLPSTDGKNVLVMIASVYI